MAAVDYFLKLEGIDGESNDAKHKNEIELQSWSWGEAQHGSHAGGSGGGAGKVRMEGFHLMMKIKKPPPKLMLAGATGDNIKKAVLTCRKAGKEQQEFLKVTLHELLVSSYQTGGSDGGDII